MALNVDVGTITAPGATGQQTYNLAVNFGLKAIILVTVGRAADGSSASTDVADLCLGMGTYRGATPQQWYCSVGGESGDQAAAHYANGSNTTDILKLYGPDMDTNPTTIDMEVALVSFGLQAGSTDLDKFTLDWQNIFTTASIIVGYIAIGGSAVTDALASSFAGSNATPQDVTVATGFGQPDLLLFGASTGSFADAGGTGTGADPKLSLAAGVSDTEQGSSLMKADDGALAMVCASYQVASVIASINAAVTAVDGEADLAAKANWPTDGFRLSWPTVTTNTSPYLALKGTFQKKIGTLTNPTAGGLPVSQDANVGFTPKLAVFFGNVLPANAAIDTTHADLGSFHIGAADGTDEWNMSWSEDDTNTVQRTRVQMDRDKGIAMWANAGGTYAVLAEADVSFSGNNVHQSWPDIDGTAREQYYLALGDPAPTAYSLDCQPGSFALTGTAATPLATRLGNAAPGSYALTGTAASPVVGRMVNAVPGSYAITGAATDVLATRLLNAAPATYAITGSAAIVGRELSLAVDPGSYVLTGMDASLLLGRSVNAVPGSYLIAGADATQLAERLISALPGAYSLDGADAQVVRDLSIVATPGGFVITGTAASPLVGRALSADPGAYALTGTLASLLAARVVAAEAGAYDLTGFVADLVGVQIGNYTISADPAAFVIDGFAASPLVARLLDSQPGTLQIDGQTAGLLADRALNASLGVYTLTGQAAGLLLGRALLAEVGALTVSGADADMALARALAALAGSFLVTGAPATFLAGVFASAPVTVRTQSAIGASRTRRGGSDGRTHTDTVSSRTRRGV